MNDLNLDLTGFDVDWSKTSESVDNDLTGSYLGRRKNTVSPELKQIMDEVVTGFPGDVAMTGLQPEPKIGKSPAQAIYQKGRKPLDQMTPEERQSVVAMDQMRQGVPSSEALANVTLGTEDPWFDPIMVTGAGAGSGARIAAAAGKKAVAGGVAGGVAALAGESIVGPVATAAEDLLPSSAVLPVNLALGVLSGGTLETALEKSILRAYERHGIKFTGENITKTATDFMESLKTGGLDALAEGYRKASRENALFGITGGAAMGMETDEQGNIVGWNPARAMAYGLGGGAIAMIAPSYRNILKGMIRQKDKNASVYEKALEIQRQIDREPTFLKYNPEKGFFDENKEYGRSIDPDVLCQKSKGTDAAVNYLKQTLGKDYDSEMAWEIIARANADGLPTPCPQCYVVPGRSKSGEAMQKKYIIGVGGYNGEFASPRTREGFLALVERSALRNYSSTDFKAEHIPGQMVQIAQAAHIGIPEAAYTKEADFAKIFGPSGMYINMSVGRDERVGMNMAEALKMREKYPNVSTIYVGFTDDEIRRVMADPNIDHVIPWHSSNQPLKELKKRLGDTDIQDYTKYQNETVFRADGRQVSVKNKKFMEEAGNLSVAETEHGGDLEKYLDLCDERNIIPKFPQFISNDPEYQKGLDAAFAEAKKTARTEPVLDHIRQYADKADPNYMKLIGPEYGKFNVPGQYPYKPVKAEFDEKYIPTAIKNRRERREEGKVGEYLKIARGIADEVKAGTYVRQTADNIEDGPFPVLRGGKAERTPPQAEIGPQAPAFKEWFGDWEKDPANASKVVGKDGKPLIVYHGSLDANSIGDSFEVRPGFVGIHFGTAKAANVRAGMTAPVIKDVGRHGVEPHQEGRGIVPVYLNIRNPIRLNDMDAWERPQEWLRPGRLDNLDTDIAEAIRQDAKMAIERGEEDKWPEMIRRLLRDDLGYDGIVYTNKYENKGSTSYMAFDPEQIKSATGNRGTYDPRTENMMYGMAGGVGAGITEDEEGSLGFDPARGVAGFAAGVAGAKGVKAAGKAMAKSADDVLPEVAHDVQTALEKEVSDRIASALKLSDDPLVKVWKKADYTAPVDPAVAEEFLRMEQSIPGEFAVNINFSKIDTEDDVKEVIAQTAKQFGGGIDAARRGKISQEQTQALADDLGMTVDQLLSRRAGQAFNAEEALAARRILVSSAVTLRDLAQKATAPTASDIDRFAFRRALNIHYGIQAQVSGMTAEAGRALAQFKILAGSQDAMVRSMKEQMDLLAATGKDAGKISTEHLAAMIATVNPEALTRTVRQMRKATTLEMLREVWINGLLSGPITHMKNMISNTLVALQQIPERAIAAGIGRVAQAVGGGRQEIRLAEAGAQLLGIKGAFEDGFRLLGNFYDLARQGDKQGAMKLLAETFADDSGKIEQRAAITGDNVLNTLAGKAVDKLGYGGQLARAADLLGEAVRIPGTALQVEDTLFKAVGYRMELHAQAYRRAVAEGLDGDALAMRVAAIINDPPEDIALEARKNADYQTFTKALGEYGTKFQAFINSHPLGSLVVPFVRTPANILKYFGERTPLALASASIRADIAAGGAKRDLALARIGLGSVIMLMAGMWGYEGTLTGGGPKDPELAAGWRRTGWQPYSVKIGGTYYEYGSLEPVGTLLGIAADIGEITARKEAGDHDLDEVAGLAVAASVAFSKNVTEKSFLQGISNVVKPLYDPERYFAQTAKNYARSLIPGAVQQLNRTEIDPVVRETMGMIDAMKAATPGLSSTLPAKRDIWGDPIEREGSLGPDWLSPIKTSEDRRSIVDDEVKRLNVQLAMPQKVLGGKYLEAGDRPRLMELIGKTPDESGLNLKQAMEALISSPDYQSLTDGEDGGKAKAIRDLYNRYKRIGTAAFLDENRPLAEAIERRKQEKQEKVHGVQF
jgi:hypothetical protein